MAAVSKAQQEAFINIIVPIAQAQAKKHNNQIYASVCIAQAIHESGWGTAPKMVKANALFGIKVGKSAYKFGTAWKGAAYKTGTTEYYDGVNPSRIVDFFRQYDSVADSVEDYYDMLCHCQRYKPALNRKTPAECIKAIVAGGYATGPQYAKKIIELIRLYNLTQYDKQPDIKKVDYLVKITAKPSLILRTSYTQASVPALKQGLPTGMILKITHECNGWGRVGDTENWVCLQYTQKI